MKLRFLFLPTVCLSLLVFSSVPAFSQTVVTFDDISNIGTGTFITNGYRGLNWTNFAPVNAILRTNGLGPSGYYYGMVSASNVVFNAFGNAAGVDSPGTNFNFLSAYFTGAWNSNLNIEVQGYRDTNLIYDETLAVSATNAILFTFNYLDIDHLVLNSFGGVSAGFGGLGEQFVMDNFEFEFIPEPSSFLLAALGAVSLVAFLRRKRV